MKLIPDAEPAQTPRPIFPVAVEISKPLCDSRGLMRLGHINFMPLKLVRDIAAHRLIINGIDDLSRIARYELPMPLIDPRPALAAACCNFVAHCTVAQHLRAYFIHNIPAPPDHIDATPSYDQGFADGVEAARLAIERDGRLREPTITTILDEVRL